MKYAHAFCCHALFYVRGYIIVLGAFLQIVYSNIGRHEPASLYILLSDVMSNKQHVISIHLWLTAFEFEQM